MTAASLRRVEWQQSPDQSLLAAARYGIVSSRPLGGAMHREWLRPSGASN